jgi:hypothetical protein
MATSDTSGPAQADRSRLWAAGMTDPDPGLPMQKIARTLRSHRPLILNDFRARQQRSSGVVEGLNNQAKPTMRKSYGFCTVHVTEIALYHALGDAKAAPASMRMLKCMPAPTWAGRCQYYQHVTQSAWRATLDEDEHYGDAQKLPNRVRSCDRKFWRGRFRRGRLISRLSG